jgi:hypothetical protein
MGRWEENQTRWYETQFIYCDLCGRVIPKQLWVEETNGERHVFCNEKCAALYHDYLHPR